MPDSTGTITTPIPDEIVAKVDELNGYTHARQNQYQIIVEQLDMLFKDIDAGKFGNDAKTGSWYLEIKKIKDDNPKPADPETLQTELDALITKHHG